MAITQFRNFAIGPNLSDGFPGSEQVNFGGRDGHFAFGVEVLAVPEPQTGALMALGLGFFAFTRLRKLKR